MHDFRCTEPDDMYYPALAKQTRYFKYDQEGVAVMCKAIEDMRNEAEQIGIQKGRAEGKAEGKAQGKSEQQIDSAKIMLEEGGFSYEQIARITGLSAEAVKELDKKRTA